MARTSSRRQVVFVKAKKNALQAKARKRAASPVDKARADRDRMVGEPAKTSRPFIAPAPHTEVRAAWRPHVSKAVVVLLVSITFIALIVFSAGKMSPNSSRDSSSSDPVMVHRSSGSQNAGNDYANVGAGQSASRAPPTDESFVSTYSRLQNFNQANSATPQPKSETTVQALNATGSYPVNQKRNAGLQKSRRDTQIDENLFAPYDGERKPVYLPNISGSCDIKSAGVNALGECLRQQLQGAGKDK